MQTTHSNRITTTTAATFVRSETKNNTFVVLTEWLRPFMITYKTTTQTHTAYPDIGSTIWYNKTIRSNLLCVLNAWLVQLTWNELLDYIQHIHAHGTSSVPPSTCHIVSALYIMKISTWKHGTLLSINVIIIHFHGVRVILWAIASVHRSSYPIWSHTDLYNVLMYSNVRSYRFELYFFDCFFRSFAWVLLHKQFARWIRHEQWT